MLVESRGKSFEQSQSMAALLDKLTGMEGRWQYEESGNEHFPHVYIELEGAQAGKLACGIAERLEKAGIFSSSGLGIDNNTLRYNGQIYFSVKHLSGKLVLEFNQQTIDDNPDLVSLFRKAEESHGQDTWHKPENIEMPDAAKWLQACIMRSNPQECERVMNALLPTGTRGKWKAENVTASSGNYTQFHLKLTRNDVVRIDDILDAMHNAGMIDKHKSVNTYGGSLFLSPNGDSSHISLIGSGDGSRFRADSCFLTHQPSETFMQMASAAEERGKARG